MATATFHFTTYVYRGRSEREYPVEVSYTVDDVVEVTDATLIGDSYPLTTDEYDRIQDECEARADEDLADWHADRADYLYEQYRDRVMMDQFEGRA